jgi:hypothetical protein
MIGKYYTDALKIMEMIEAAPKTRRSDDEDEDNCDDDDE